MDLRERRDQVYPAALAYLAHREYAESELRQRLLRRGAEAEAVDEAIDRLRQGNWLSEERFAYSRVRQRRDITGRGRAAIRSELRSLGVEDSLVEAALEGEYDRQREAEAVARLAQKALRGLEDIPDPQLKHKKLQAVQRRLLARGFSPALVQEATGEYSED